LKVGLYQSDRPARACARMYAVLNIHSKIFFAFVLFRGHEFDAHFLGTSGDRALEHLCELKWLFAQGDHVEKESTSFVPRAFSTANFIA